MYDFFIEPKDEKTGELLINPSTGKPFQPEELIETKVELKDLPGPLARLFEGREDQLKYSRVWIPSYVSDNPMAVNDPAYITALATMSDEKQVRAFLFGDWKAFRGKFFSEFCEKHIVQPRVLPPWTQRWGSLDIDRKSTRLNSSH